MKLMIDIKTTRKQAFGFIESMRRSGYVPVTKKFNTHFVLDGVPSADYNVYIDNNPRGPAYIQMRPQ